MTAHQLLTDTITTEAAFDRLMPEWQALFERHAPTPFADPRLVWAWWRIRGSRQGCKLHIVVGRRQGQVVAVAPLSVSRRGGARFLRWAGDEVYDYCDVLLADQLLNDVFWREVQLSGGYDVALIKNIMPGTDTHRTLAAGSHCVRSSRIFKLGIEWGSSAEWVRCALSTKSRKRLRYVEKRLSQRGRLSFEVVVQPDDPRVAHIVDALVRQKADWTRARNASEGLFSDREASVALLQGIAAIAGKSGTMHLSCLKCGDEIIAAHLGLVHRGVFYYYIPSYAATWSAFSPGRLLILKLIGWAVDNQLEVFDFMRGDDDYKAQYANAECDSSDFTYSGSFAGRILEALLDRWYFNRPALLQACKGSAIYGMLAWCSAVAPL